MVAWPHSLPWPAGTLFPGHGCPELFSWGDCCLLSYCYLTWRISSCMLWSLGSLTKGNQRGCRALENILPSSKRDAVVLGCACKVPGALSIPSLGAGFEEASMGNSEDLVFTWATIFFLCHQSTHSVSSEPSLWHVHLPMCTQARSKPKALL